MNETYEKQVDATNYIASSSRSFFKNVGKLLYMFDPRETTYEFYHQVPDYQQQVWLSFFVLIILENVILYAKKENSFRLNDHVTSLSHWIFQESGRVLFRGAEYYAYILLYEKYRIWSLPWDSLWTWYITAIGVDFCYYWVHRANHEIHFLWAHHQVHHSSEEFNLVVGLRQSVLQHWCSFVFYLPLAFFIPPSHYVAHHQFNLIYQLWIHTTVIDDLGPLEFIFNTPKHHRVHHGCNLYCLDKNYGGVLIIWDRMFGTFMEQRAQEDIIYGLVVSPRTFNPLYLQMFYAKAMIEKSLSQEKMRNKLAVMWKGPSWFPGSPRLGLDEFKVNVTSRMKYGTAYLPSWQTFYITVHFCIVFYVHLQFYDERREFNFFTSSSIVLNNVFTLTAIGLLFDEYEYANIVELVRCTVNLALLECDRDANARSSNDNIYYLYLCSCPLPHRPGAICTYIVVSKRPALPRTEKPSQCDARSMPLPAPFHCIQRISPFEPRSKIFKTRNRTSRGNHITTPVCVTPSSLQLTRNAIQSKCSYILKISSS